ncbi:hypothetical protein BY996DRAFT_8545354, partial [Phakopsora pachyrhizi]
DFLQVISWIGSGCSRLNKRFKQPVLGRINLVLMFLYRLCRLLVQDLNMITDRLHQTILSLTNVAGSENPGSSGFNEADVLEFYSSLMYLQKKHDQCNSNFPLDIPFDELFLPYVNSWLDSADCKTSEWDYNYFKCTNDYNQLLELIEPKKAEEIYANYTFWNRRTNQLINSLMISMKIVDFYQKAAKLLKPVDNAEEKKSINKAIMATYARMKRLAEKRLIESQDEKLETIEEASQRIYTEEILIIMEPAFIRYKIYCSNEFLDLFSNDFIKDKFLCKTTGKPEKIGIETKETEPPFTGLGTKTFSQLAIQSKELKRRMPLIYEKLESLEEKRNIIKSKLNDMGDLGQYFVESMEQVTKNVPLVHCDDSQLFVIHKNKT